MSPTTQGILVLVVTILVFMTGAPVAFGLGAVGVGFLVLFQGADSLKVAAETLYSGPARLHGWCRSRCSS